MFPMLRVALRIQDMLILLAIGCVLLSIVYLIDQFRAELKKSGVEKTNFTPWHSPHFHFLMMALMIGVGGVFSPADQMLDIQLHDTYLVISVGVIGVVAAAYFLFVSFVYFMARRLSLARWMVVLHLALSVAAGVAFYLYYPNLPVPSQISDLDTLIEYQFRNKTIRFFCTVGVLAQALLPLNLLISWWRRR
jgi:hypothetical protein